MQFRRLIPGDEGLAEIFLLKHIESSMFLLSNLRNSGLNYLDKHYHGDYFASFNLDGSINGILAHYWNGNIMVQAPELDTIKPLFARCKKQITRPIMGLHGPKEQVDILFIEMNVSHSICSADLNDELYSLELANINDLSGIDKKKYHMNDVSKSYEDLIYTWLMQYEIEALGGVMSQQTRERIRDRANRIIQEKSCWILLDNETPVSLCGFNARLSAIVQLGPVWTPPEYRCRGYARILTSLVLKNLTGHHVKKAILFTNNVAAIKVYSSLGFQKIGYYRLVILRDGLTI